MRTRSTLALLALFLALAAVAYLSRGPRERGASPEATAVFPGLAALEVRRISVGRPEGSLELLRLDDGWTVAEGEGEAKPADAAAVDRLLEALTGLAGGTVVSTNPDRRDGYGLGAGEGLAVRIEGAAEERLADFSVGRSGPDFASSYLVRAGEDPVLLVPADLGRLLGRTADAWRDRSALGLGPEEITAVRIERGGEALGIGRAEDGAAWLVAGRPADPGAVGRYLDQLGALRAIAFAEPGEEGTGLERPEGTVIVEGAGRSVVLAVGALKEGAGQRYLRSSRFSDTLLVAAGTADSLLKSAEDFPDSAPPASAEP